PWKARITPTARNGQVSLRPGTWFFFSPHRHGQPSSPSTIDNQHLSGTEAGALAGQVYRPHLQCHGVFRSALPGAGYSTRLERTHPERSEERRAGKEGMSGRPP